MATVTTQSTYLAHIMSRKKIIIIDDHSLYRMGLIVALKAPLPYVQIIEAANVEDALKSCKSVNLVLLDIDLDGVNGLAFIPSIKAAWPEAKIIVLSANRQEDCAKDAISAGADDFLSKSLMSSQVISSIVAALDRTGGISNTRPQLTRRQLQILELMNRGFTNKTIAQQFEISENTVRWHVQLILTTLDASSRSEAIFNARNFGLII